MKRWIAWIQIVVPMLFLLVVIANLLARFPDNHGDGFDYLYQPFYWSWGLVLFFGIPFRTIDLRGLVCGLSVLALFFFSDKYNLYLEYEEWLCRGMPEWGSFDDGWRNRDAETLKSLQEEESAERCEYPTSLRACAIAINEIEDFKTIRQGKAESEPRFHVYVADNVPWAEVPLKPLGDIARSNDRLVPSLSEAFSVPFWMSDQVAVFAPKIYDGRFVIEEGNNDSSGWLDTIIPSDLSYRPRLQDIATFPEHNHPGYSFSIDAACKDLIVPLVEIRLTWRHFFEMLTRILPVNVTVKGTSVSIAQKEKLTGADPNAAK